MFLRQGVAELAHPKHDAPACFGKDASQAMASRSHKRWPIAASAALLAACAATPQPTAREVADANDTGRRLTAQTDAERGVLREVASLPSGVARRVGNAQVTAESAYNSASGRTCRALALTISQHTVHRLACSDGQAWFFVPDVFGGAESLPTD